MMENIQFSTMEAANYTCCFPYIYLHYSKNQFKESSLNSFSVLLKGTVEHTVFGYYLCFDSEKILFCKDNLFLQYKYAEKTISHTGMQIDCNFKYIKTPCIDSGDLFANLEMLVTGDANPKKSCEMLVTERNNLFANCERFFVGCGNFFNDDSWTRNKKIKIESNKIWMV
jgi:hypothetical protein